MTDYPLTIDSFRSGIVPRWSDLSRLGKSRLLRSSYIWFFVVPIAAKASEWEIPGNSLSYLNWELPFSWEVFYFAAVCFAIASAVYQFFCPILIQEYPNFSQFLEHGKGDRQLAEYVIPSIAPSPGRRRLSGPQVTRFRGFLECAENTREVWAMITDEHSIHAANRALAHIRIGADDLSNAFWYLRDVADVSRPFLRGVCAILYVLGFGLSFIVTLQDVVSVLQVAF